MTSAHPQPQPQAQPHASAPQPHHPPQAYPAPPGNAAQPRGAQSQARNRGQGGGVQPAGHDYQNVHDAHGGQGDLQQDIMRRSRTGARTVPRTRKARLRVAKVDPWSVMKVGFLLSIALGICTIIAVAVLWMVMDAMGVFSAVGGMVSEATATDDGGGFDLQNFLSLSRVLTFTSVVAVIDVVLVTALATLGAFIYNLSAGFVGGVEVTLAEDE
ncbi:hypothetical protein F0L17_12830 [Streptomyces sp. TRM43335]|uniref:DUF3566 domain-containing protein n=1 Tax=Streptomyces taklimakanensis TaxID=2569853 RepID=A0A6G2BCN9_9ACTN|nr:hypothetical protein [Streptomyces taklimakanensis]